MNLGIDAIRTADSMMANGYDFITRGLNAGKPSKESQEAIFEREQEEERKRISPVYDARGKIVDSSSIRYFVSKEIKGKKSKRINILA